MPTLRPAVACAALAAAATTAPLGAATAQAPTLDRPNLDARVPRALDLSFEHHRMLLISRAAVHNTGDGPLILAGRADRSVVQRVKTSTNSTRVLHGAGRLVFERGAWRLAGALHYDLRRAGSRTLVRRTTAGLCLHDGYDIDSKHRVSREPDGEVFDRNCRVRMGLSAGWGEAVGGGALDVTRLRSGRYWLIHRFDPAGHIRETDETDDAAAVLIDFENSETDTGGHRYRARTLRFCNDASRC